MFPFFSVVLSSYNRRDSILRVVDKILDQQFADFELIIIDDCSTDGSAALLSRIEDSRVNFISTYTNSGGPAIPRNIGIKRARGKWICFCDSDDYFEYYHLQYLYEFIQKNNLDNAIISTNAYLFKDGKATDQIYFPSLDSGEISFSNNWKSNKAILSSLCIRNNDLIEFCDKKEYHSIEDYFFLLDNMLHGKKHFFLKTPTIYYSINSTDSVRSKSRSGERIYKYKYEFSKKWKLFTGKNSMTISFILLRDYCKGIIKSIAG